MSDLFANVSTDRVDDKFFFSHCIAKHHIRLSPEKPLRQSKAKINKLICCISTPLQGHKLCDLSLPNDCESITSHFKTQRITYSTVSFNVMQQK